MKRQIIKIDQEKCNGCGLCVPNCPEGAIQMIDGKARLISDLFCDGLGACIGECPEGAIEIEEREAVPYDEGKVMANIVKQGANTIKAHLKHLRDHDQKKFLQEAVMFLKENKIPLPDLEEKHHFQGCPGSRQRVIKREKSESTENISLNSELSQWPTQLNLVSPDASFFENSDLLVCADCVPFAHANFHSKLLKGKSLVMFCPKLDHEIDVYIDKLALMFSNKNIKSVTIARMEVPCCGGTEMIVKKAMEKAGANIEVKVQIINIDGTLRS
ncbi:MAG: 4Fe-4S dicluster domain-containing protein [bacterium]|nr:4Fe-4S dicluster domain-containing protein [bacterium]